MRTTSYLKQPVFLALMLGVNLCSSPLAGAAESSSSSGSETIQDKGQQAVSKVEALWQRIDERRLKNRTPDEIVAWVIMGLLVSGLLYRLGGRGQIASILLGLIGAFIGGIVAHVAQLDFGLGPILITYEDLICSLVGGLLILGGARWLKVFKIGKPL
jgi:uncharacterized membrane protein YeaQ/YmgE (transglycosylase-associated protein family)